MQILQRCNTRPLVGSKIAQIGIDQQPMEPINDDAPRFLAVDLATRSFHQFLQLLFIGAQVALQLPDFVLKRLVPRQALLDAGSFVFVGLQSPRAPSFLASLACALASLSCAFSAFT